MLDCADLMLPLNLMLIIFRRLQSLNLLLELLDTIAAFTQYKGSYIDSLDPNCSSPLEREEAPNGASLGGSYERKGKEK